MSGCEIVGVVAAVAVYAYVAIVVGTVSGLRAYRDDVATKYEAIAVSIFLGLLWPVMALVVTIATPILLFIDD